jgi:phosphate:Na+ symporter
LIPSLLGGIGLFLLGMILMTEGLKSAAGDALRDTLARLTGGAGKAFLSGAGLTVLVQSSSATILATIGFVSAGLLVFSQAVGVILGAAVGTTSTGWLVSFLGLKYSVSVLALPLVGIGALLRLLGRGRWTAIGLALAGFGLIFVGIDTLQVGMQGLAERIDLSGFRYENFAHRVLLVVVGVVMTVVMQSSSAAVATTLAALHAGTIDLAQAATLVIGQAIGTTVTAALAIIGASVAARRTGWAHILFNAFAGLVGFVSLPFVLPWLYRASTMMAAGEAGAIAAFHTGFTLAGAAVVLPWAGTYAVLIARLVPERGSTLTRNLDASVRAVPEVAVEAARRSVREIAARIVMEAAARLGGAVAGRPGEWSAVAISEPDAALAESRRFLAGVQTSPEAGESYARHLSVLHAIDHLERLASALRDALPPATIPTDPVLRRQAEGLEERLRVGAEWLQSRDEGSPRELEETSGELAGLRRDHRPMLLAETAAGGVDPDQALRILDTMRWLDRIAYHVWRAGYHLSAEGASDTSAAPEPAAP